MRQATDQITREKLDTSPSEIEHLRKSAFGRTKDLCGVLELKSMFV